MGKDNMLYIDSAPLCYLLSVPHTYQSSPKVWPLLCFLHGHDEAAPLEIHHGVTRHGPLRKESSNMARDDFIVVAPQLPLQGDIWYKYDEAVLQIVTEVQRAYRVDPGRTYLTGFSYGGNGVFDLAMVQYDFWAALWPVDPTRVPDGDPGRPVWLSFGEVSRRYKKDFIDSLDLKPATETSDGDRLYLDQGEDHVGSALHAYRDDRIYTWLMSQYIPA